VSRGAKIAVALVFGLVLLAIALWGIDLGEMREQIARARAAWLVAAGALYLLAYVIRSLRWRLILSPIRTITVGESFSIMMAGYFLNYVIPIRAGEVAKSLFLKRLRGVPVATSLPTVFVDKLLELVSIVLVLLLVPILSIDLEGPLAVLVFAVLAVFVLAVAVLVLAFRNEARATALLCRLFAWLPRRAYARIAEWMGLFVRGMGVARHNLRALAPLLGLTGAAVLTDACYFLIMFRAFGIEVAFLRVLFGYTLLTLSYILPTPPAQIGYNELVIGLIFAGGLTGAAIPRGEVMAVVIVAHALTGLIITGVGLWAFGSMGIRVSESFRGAGGDPAPAGSAESGGGCRGRGG
jgi:uncharacterized protein (TIRG00374 family)